MNGANGRPSNSHEGFMTYEMCRRFHDEFSARIDVSLQAGNEKISKIEKNVACLNAKLSSIKTWVIVTLAVLVVDLVRGVLVYMKVLK